MLRKCILSQCEVFFYITKDDDMSFRGLNYMYVSKQLMYKFIGTYVRY